MRMEIVLAAIFTVMTGNSVMARPDMDAGRMRFSRDCSTCHSLKRGETLQGPSLAGVFGRRAGSLADFNYSDTMRKSKVIWTDSELDSYLTSPFMMMGSGINMMAHGIADEDARADLIEFLKHQH